MSRGFEIFFPNDRQNDSNKKQHNTSQWHFPFSSLSWHPLFATSRAPPYAEISPKAKKLPQQSTVIIIIESERMVFSSGES
jgi:hypothetical protein